MNFRKASIFQRDTEKPAEQNDSGGMLAVWLCQIDLALRMLHTESDRKGFCLHI